MQVDDGRVAPAGELPNGPDTRPPFRFGRFAVLQDQGFVHRRVVRKNRGKGGFDQNVEFQSGPPALQCFNQRQRQNGVAQRSDADQQNARNLFKFPAQRLGRVGSGAGLQRDSPWSSSSIVASSISITGMPSRIG